ncbi:DUF2272 domain-containing protein [Zavarzinia compransoris]|uniref:DUF2272 domain-containing protein n=1 Tax=Zavarzinia compransoris TaxID=1264899 RepID=A0A317DVN0_9PROT|nr:DUF2272 domain-containing protein [Zavarzinia compransoris]PWR18739.1 hypothetical protein DKG75_17285 [Zavarzinia compransoris]TDP48722.1 uncharacterized protein DUF2272 [Zavarzinia compransoris]
MTTVEKLVQAARAEWTRWGGPVLTREGKRLGFSYKIMEGEHPYWTYVGAYWKEIGSDLDGRDRSKAWSGAFISYCFAKAGAGKKFPESGNHSEYVASIATGKFAGLQLVDAKSVPLAVGDLLWATRRGDGCRKPPATFEAALVELDGIAKGKADTFCSHVDIVVALRPGEVDVIGGNVDDAVTRTTYILDQQGLIADARRSFIGVVKNTMA